MVYGLLQKELVWCN